MKEPHLGNMVIIRNEGGQCQLKLDSHGNLVIDTLFVDATKRRQGYGSALLVSTARLARMLHRKRVIVECSPGNEPAKALYEKAGFHAVSIVYQLDLE